MVELLLAGDGAQTLIKPIPGDEELYFPGLDFQFVVEGQSGSAYAAAMETIETVLGFVKGLDVIFGVANITDKWINAIEEHLLNRRFQYYIVEEKRILNELSTRRGGSMTFMIQKYSVSWENEDGETETSSFLRCTPVGFGTDVGSALTYAMAVEEKRVSREFEPEFPRSIHHDAHDHAHQWSTYLSVSLTTQGVKVLRTGDAKNTFKLAHATAQTLGGQLLIDFDQQSQDLTEIWKDYRLATGYFESVRNREFRNIVAASTEGNLAGFRRVKRLEDAYRKASAEAKASTILSHLTQIISFASSVQNYVEVRDAKVERQKQEAKRSETFRTLSDSLSDFSSELGKQRDSIEKLGVQLDQEDRNMIPVLVPYEALEETRSEFATEFDEDTNYLSDQGPISRMGNDSNFSADFQMGSFRLKVSF